ncbi:MAG TPA: tRNA pseudouridine(38-40) synthase TruA [Vicinamibacterales bacterium]|nr:tRNA pseudouridine(38-40) synthase TruA [Vicinamibacterales bacterium]
MRTLKLTIAYDGTAFAGWQMQAHQRTVQGVLEDALQPIEGTRVVVHAAGRTDAGVHAAGQVVSFSLTSAIACDALVRALNVRLDQDVRVMNAEDAPEGFNARFDARRKTYHYAIYNAPVVPPPWRHFVWHVPQPLDVAAMNEAAAALAGEHDFAAFQAAGSDVATTRREILASRVVSRDAQVVYEVTGTGFLRHMVRNIAGTLVDIGRSRRPVEDMARVLQTRDRTHASATAPAHGLTLMRVEY